MQPYTEYVALRPLRAPGTMVYGFQTGDGVPAATVDSWELAVGVDVLPRDTGVIARPGKDSDDRVAWEAYAIGQGRTRDEVVAASLADLKATPEPETDETGAPVTLPDPFAPPVRPEPDARKADWVEYVIATGADREWAAAKTTTKADLQDYSPSRDVVPAPDPVAVSASAVQADAQDESPETAQD